MEPEELAPDPIVQVQRWLAEAEAAGTTPAAMTLATATPAGRPSARIVLLRGLDARGFVFFTNRESRKGLELGANPQAALVFHWWELGRQLRVEGSVEPVEDDESEAYWETRPRASRIAAWISPQSRPIADRRALDEQYAQAAESFGDDAVPLPPFWGGYRLRPETIEFWLHRDDRLHDRVRYSLVEKEWRRERLAP
jgi:pyridoxamine 5'-phosphate oxidase